jgi:hypothetical protein
MKQRAFNQPLGNGVVVKVNSDQDGVSFDKHHVVIGDVIRFAIRQANAERLERLQVHAFLEFQCGYHGLSLSLPANISSRGLVCPAGQLC